MIRVVVSVLLGLAILAASVPAVEHAGAERSDATVRAALDDLDDAAVELAREEEFAPGAPGPRRIATVELPRDGLASAPVEYVRVDPADRSYRYRVAGRRERSVRARAPLATPDGAPLELTGPGEHRLRLALAPAGSDRCADLRSDGSTTADGVGHGSGTERCVVVRRAGGAAQTGRGPGGR